MRQTRMIRLARLIGPLAAILPLLAAPAIVWAAGGEAGHGPAEEPCKDYPKKCAACPAYECTALLPDEDDDEPMAERLVVRSRKKGEKAWKEMSDKTMEKNPALCRFLTAIASAHGL